jgi:hypothetical protein
LRLLALNPKRKNREDVRGIVKHPFLTIKITACLDNVHVQSPRRIVTAERETGSRTEIMTMEEVRDVSIHVAANPVVLGIDKDNLAPSQSNTLQDRWLTSRGQQMDRFEKGRLATVVLSDEEIDSGQSAHAVLAKAAVTLDFN